MADKNNDDAFLKTRWRLQNTKGSKAVKQPIITAIQATTSRKRLEEHHNPKEQMKKATTSN